MSDAELYVILLAAGAGKRFGGRKLLAPFRDGVLVEGALAAAFAAPAERVFLVTGTADLAAAARAFALQSGQEERLRVVPVADPQEGLSVSLRAGIAALPPSATGAFVFLGDMPGVPHGVAGRLAKALEGSPALAAAPAFRGRRGHPVLLRKDLFPLLGQLRGDRGAGGLLGTLGEGLLQVEVPDEGVLRDIDRPEDLAAATN
jgi:molybdenum cofactor cytidylyltransferase